jgi:hypothetical protein
MHDPYLCQGASSTWPLGGRDSRRSSARGRSGSASRAATRWRDHELPPDEEGDWDGVRDDLHPPFGVRSASDRARKFGAALGLPNRDAGGPFVLGSPDLLVGEGRPALIEERDDFR